MTERPLEHAPARPPQIPGSSFSEEEETQEHRWKGYVIRVGRKYVVPFGIGYGGTGTGPFADALIYSSHADALADTQVFGCGVVWSYLRAAREEAERGKA